MRSNCGSEKIYHSKIVLVNKKNQTARKRARRRAAARGTIIKRAPPRN